jgi:phosphoethanolamine N-methyltransferase
MEHESEYHDAMVTLLELIWGEGYMAPGGAGNVANIAKGLELRDKRVLDIGCGIGGPALELARSFGANVVGTDLDPKLIARARESARRLGLDAKTDFRVVEAGPLASPEASFDYVVSSGAFTQIAEKLAMFKEVLRVLKPGGVFSCYDWMKAEGEYSDDMLYFFEVEGLTYAMETPERYVRILEQAGFVDVSLREVTDWYRSHVHIEYEKIRGELYPRMLELIGREQADHFVENWRAMTIVCDKRELRQAYVRGRKP